MSEEFKVGDRVSWCGVEGEVISVAGHGIFPLRVDFYIKDEGLITCTFAKHGKYFSWHKEPSLKKLEPKTAYYKWRLWFKGGDIFDSSYPLTEKGCYADGIACPKWKEAIKREKISEAIYKCEGQE